LREPQILLFSRLSECLVIVEQHQRHLYQVKRPLRLGKVAPVTLEGFGQASAVVLVFHRFLAKTIPSISTNSGQKSLEYIRAWSGDPKADTKSSTSKFAVSSSV
jgi:hypothetical protein